MGKGPTPVLSEVSIFGERAREWLQETLSDPGSTWFNDEIKESRDALIVRSLREAMDYLKKRLGPNFEAWSWGKLHQLTFRHNPLGNVKPLSGLFNRGPFPIGGDHDTVWASGSGYLGMDSYQMTSAPFRFIADLSNLDHSLGCLAPGQSGLPTSPHYDDQIEDWFNGRYHPMLYTRESVDKHKKSVLWLRPT
jgi:penicillin amidase